MRSRNSQRGAVAIVVAVMSITLFGIAAFTVDFGMAYVSKRQLQTAADAGALAAASTYMDLPGDCADLSSDTAAKTVAQAAADDIRESNRPGSSGSAINVECGDYGQLNVTYATQGDTDIVFGGLLGATDDITTGRTATASVDVPPEIIGLRPYMLCSGGVPDDDEVLPTPVMRVGFPTTADAETGPCPTGTANGNWWAINCPEDSSNSNNDLAEKTRDGCLEPVSIVDAQPEPEDSPPNTALHDVLIDACDAGPDEDCLSASPGVISGAEIWAAWSGLLGKEIILPVFCGESVCDPAAVVQGGGGENTMYPVHKFAGVTVCGYHWGAAAQKHGGTNAGLCANNPSGYDHGDGGEAENYLLLVYSQVRTSGSTGSSSCGLDDGCDGGLRRVLLTK